MQYTKNTDSETILIKRNFLKKQFLRLVINSLIVLNPSYDYNDLKTKLDVIIAKDSTSVLSEHKEKNALSLLNKKNKISIWKVFNTLTP